MLFDNEKRRGISNEILHFRYAKSAKKYIDLEIPSVHPMFRQGEYDNDLMEEAVVRWGRRYHLRFCYLSGNETDVPIDDRPALGLLINRNRQRDEQFADAPPWPPNTVRAINSSASIAGAWARGDTMVSGVTTWGPSLRNLWWTAKNRGGSDEDAIRAILNWAVHVPDEWQKFENQKTLEPVTYYERLSALLNQAVLWDSTGDFDYPWSSSQFPGQTWRVRLNDFPDEIMYTLLIGDEIIGDFHDWPSSWTRAEGPGYVDRKALKKPAAKKKVKRPVVREDIDLQQLLPRYQAGDCKAVWADLSRLGQDARKPPYLDPALAVCREMVLRSRKNLLTIIGRLHEMEYLFWSQGQNRLMPLENVTEPWKDEAGVWSLGNPQVASALAQFEKGGITLPLALRIFAEELGAVDLNGSHPVLCPMYHEAKHPKVYADPLMVLPIAGVLQAFGDEEDEEDGAVMISFADVHKAEMPLNYGVDFAYRMRYPSRGVDRKVEGLWFEATFVEYLRKSFEWGGFPGWERYPERPEKELAFLREGLLPI